MTKAMTEANHAKLIRAQELCNRYLGDANEAEERGNYAKAEKLHEKSQYWHDRTTKLMGWGE